MTLWMNSGIDLHWLKTAVLEIFLWYILFTNHKLTNSGAEDSGPTKALMIPENHKNSTWTA